ncbi:MAG: MMPL family transporter [Elusimicrobiota bacterium]|jgi:predicted exporter|nr:MMPL family transporter [Elusimicrobiota bacterium]
MKPIKKNGIFLSCFIIFFIICAALFSQIKYRENILIMLPNSIRHNVELFQASPFSKKFFIVVEAPDGAVLAQSAGQVAAAMQNMPQIRQAVQIDRDFILSYYYNLPNIWTGDIERQIKPLLTKQAIEKRIEENMTNLMGPQGQFLKDFILADPIGVMSVAFEYLKDFNITNGTLNFENGYFTSEDGTKALLIYDTGENVFDRQNADALIAALKEVNKTLPPGSKTFAMGTARYTQENNNIIAKDVRRVLTISIILMIIVFLFFFRQRHALFIYAVPVLVLIPAAVFTYFIFGGISGITLGFGSVLMSLAIDYSVYMYFAMKAAPAGSTRVSVMKAMFRPITISALTSIISFTALYFSSIELFRQICVFAVSGLLYALFIAFCAAPLMFKFKGEPEKDFKTINKNTAFSVIFISLIIAGGIIGIKFLKFDASFDSLNTVSEQFLKDRAVFDELTGKAAQQGSLLFVFGKNKDEALDNSRKIALAAGQNMPLNNILTSSQASLENKEKWHKFWTADKIKRLENTVKNAAIHYGLKANAFDDFFEFLKTAKAPEKIGAFDLTRIYNPFISYNGRQAVVHAITENNFILPQTYEQNAVLISQNLIQKDLFYSIMKTLAVIITIVFISNFILLMIIFRKIKLVLLAFVPILCAISAIIIVCALFSIKINLFSIFSIPLIIGLGVDYAIFIIHQKISSSELYPSRAVAAAALLSIAGFGALIFAEHKALFAIGFTISIGIAAAGLISIYLLPALLKNYKTLIPFLLSISLFLTACSGAKHVGIKYNVPAILREGSNTCNIQDYYGEIDGQMLFHAAAACEDSDTVRVVIMSEIGTKLVDMSVSKYNIDVHFRLVFLPKRAVSALGKFFRDFYFNKKKLVKTPLDEMKILYNNIEKSIVLWVNNDN